MLLTLFFSLLSVAPAQADASLVCRNNQQALAYISSNGSSKLYRQGVATEESVKLGEEHDAEETEEVRSCETGHARGTYVNARHFNSELTLSNGKVAVACEIVDSFSVPCADDFIGNEF